MKRFWLVFVLILAACSPRSEVIRDNSAAQTRTAVVINATEQPGAVAPTRAAYARPTDDLTLGLKVVLAKLGDNTITLDEFRQRVRYERYATLAHAYRIVARNGVKALQDIPPAQNPPLQMVLNLLNSVNDFQAFGSQVHDRMLLELITRKEAAARNLKASEAELQNYWVETLDLKMNAADIPAFIDKFQDAAAYYSGLSKAAMTRLAETAVLTDKLRPLVTKDHLPSPVQYRLDRLIVASQADADKALSQIKQGKDFRAVACDVARPVSAPPTFTGKVNFVAGLSAADLAIIFAAEKGTVIGPIQSPVGWYLFRIQDTRKNADGDTEIAAQSVIVATRSQADDLRARLDKGESFERLACLYATPSDFIDPTTLPAELADVLKTSKDNDVLGPFRVDNSLQIVRVVARQMKVLKPEELQSAQAQAFRAWQAEQLPSVEQGSNSWLQAIPADPAPGDVSMDLIQVQATPAR